MRQEIECISLDKINPLFEASVSKAFKGRMSKTKSSLETYDILLAVIKIPNKDSYILVGGFDRYSYLRDCNELKAPCIVEDSSTIEEMHLKVLNRFYPKGDTKKENKKQSLVLLQESGMSRQSIVEGSCMTMSDLINNYSYNPNIPKQYIKKNAVIKTLNEIQRLEITTEAKYHLYFHAGVEIGKPERLTGEVISIIKQLSKTDNRVQRLTTAQQIETFDKAFNPKRSMLNILKDTVSRFIPFD